jgi:heat shock protein HtpX
VFEAMRHTAYRAIESNRRRSMLLTGVSAAFIVAMFGASVWILGYDNARVLGPIGSGFVGGLFVSRDFVVALLRAHPLTAAEAPKLHARLDALCAVFGLRVPPDVYVVSATFPNALSLDRIGGRGALVVTSSVLQLSGDELDAVLAHELSHLASSVAGLRVVSALLSAIALALAATRSLVVVVAIALVIGLSLLLLGPAPLYFVLMLFVFVVADARISRRREDIADGQAVLATRYPEGLLRVLRRSLSWSSGGSMLRSDDASRVAASLWMIRPAGARTWMDRALDAHPSLSHRIRHVELMS